MEFARQGLTPIVILQLPPRLVLTIASWMIAGNQYVLARFRQVALEQMQRQSPAANQCTEPVERLVEQVQHSILRSVQRQIQQRAERRLKIAVEIFVGTE